MSWEELQIETPRQDIGAVTALLFHLGCSGLQEDYLPGETPAPRQPWDTGPLAPEPARALLKAWFENPDREAISAQLLAIHGTLPPPRWEPLPDTDWENDWKRHFPILEISPRIVIAPPWDPRPGAILIEPGQGFGSGQHPTTRAALIAVDELASQGTTLLDVGCGSGILAIAGALLGLDVAGIDIDPVAVEDARKNAQRNGLELAFSTTPIPNAAPADLVVANLHAELLTKYAEDLIRLTQKWLVVAGVLADREGLVQAALGRLELIQRVQDGEWVSLRYRRP